MIKIITVVGARPQFVKAAAVSRELAKRSGIKELILHTGQHYDKNMSDIFFDEMEIPKPDFFLNINGLSHGAMTGQMLEKIEEVLIKEKPDLVMVYGDTNSTLAGALAAKKLQIKLIHVEAGLRSFNMKMPEEINRIVTDRISDILFCPTDAAVKNLKTEGIIDSKIKVIQCGDVMEDAALYYAKKSTESSQIIQKLSLEKSGFILCTIHRQENTDSPERLESIFSALNEINRTSRIICPLHPRTQKIISVRGLKAEFTVIEPVGYFDMLELLKNCRIVLTDSGGLQKEAFFFAKPCVTLRDETEWVELVQNGFNVLAGSDGKKILEAVRTVSERNPDFSVNLYGRGNACRVIADSLEKLFR